ncbi:hypothetical protein [Paenarthrobacter nitroguajacolicus]|uniref:hypothetical protein n=1 Tax=Paenarthrobacter nitroguajacolicus TaxID=211146 RepID=UPI003AF3F44C
MAVGSGVLVPGWGEGSTMGTGWVGAAPEEAGVLGGAVVGAGVGAAGAGVAAGTTPTDGVSGTTGAEAEGAGAEAAGAVLVEGTSGVTETVGKGAAPSGAAGPTGTAVQPATHKPKTRQAAVIAVVLFGPRPACMTAPRSCPSTCTSNVRMGRRNTTCRYGDGSDKS